MDENASEHDEQCSTLYTSHPGIFVCCCAWHAVTLRIFTAGSGLGDDDAGCRPTGFTCYCWGFGVTGVILFSFWSTFPHFNHSFLFNTAADVPGLIFRRRKIGIFHALLHILTNTFMESTMRSIKRHRAIVCPTTYFAGLNDRGLDETPTPDAMQALHLLHCPN